MNCSQPVYKSQALLQFFYLKIEHEKVILVALGCKRSSRTLTLLAYRFRVMFSCTHCCGFCDFCLVPKGTFHQVGKVVDREMQISGKKKQVVGCGFESWRRQRLFSSKISIKVFFDNLLALENVKCKFFIRICR